LLGIIYKMVSIFILSVFFILGLIVGSFLNVFIFRHKTGLGYSGRSFCFYCGHTLSWYYLIPIVSFILQKGRCRYCNIRISIQYPLVELATGIIFVLVILRLGISLSINHLFIILFYLFTFSILVAIAFYDVRHKIIPNILVYFFSASGLFFALSKYFIVKEHSFLIGGLALALPIIILWVISRGKWIGLGDAKLVLGIGWILGISGGYAALIIAVWIGSVAGVFLVILGKIAERWRSLFPGVKRFTIKNEIPFAPFLILGTIIVFFYGISLVDIQSVLTFY